MRVNEGVIAAFQRCIGRAFEFLLTGLLQFGRQRRHFAGLIQREEALLLFAGCIAAAAALMMADSRIAQQNMQQGIAHLCAGPFAGGFGLREGGKGFFTEQGLQKMIAVALQQEMVVRRQMRAMTRQIADRILKRAALGFVPEMILLLNRIHRIVLSLSAHRNQMTFQ
jgi:hypothetical protein